MMLNKCFIYLTVIVLFSVSVISFGACGTKTNGEIVRYSYECENCVAIFDGNNLTCASLQQSRTPDLLTLREKNNISIDKVNKKQSFESVTELQDISGSTSIQIGTNAHYPTKTAMIEEKIELLKAYILSLMKLIIEFFKIIFYVIEVKLFIYFFIVLIPNGFFKLRDALVQLFLKRI